MLIALEMCAEVSCERRVMVWSRGCQTSHTLPRLSGMALHALYEHITNSPLHDTIKKCHVLT